MAPSRLLTGAAGRYLELVDRIAPAADALQPAERHVGTREERRPPRGASIQVSGRRLQVLTQGCANAALRLASVEVADTAGGRAKLPDSLDSADMEAHSLSPGLTHEVLNTSITAAEAEFFKCIQQDPAQVYDAASLMSHHSLTHRSLTRAKRYPSPKDVRSL
jgi:hypothetical protein